MKHLRPLIVLSSLMAFSGAVLAEEVHIPAGKQADGIWEGETPIRGASMSQVEKKFGEPSSQHGPKGTPPIYYWEYPDFTVYFESDYVIHTVIKHRPNTN